MNSTTTHIGKQELCGQSVDVVADSVIDNPVLPCCIPRGNPANSCKGSLRLKRPNGGCREILAYRNVGVECPQVLVAEKGCDDCCKQGVSTPFCIDGCKVSYYAIENCELIEFDEAAFIGFYCMDELELAPPCVNVTDGYDNNPLGGGWTGQGGQASNLFNVFELWAPTCCDLIIKLRHYEEDPPSGFVYTYSYLRIPKRCSYGDDFLKGGTTCLDWYYRSEKWDFLFDQMTITSPVPNPNCDISLIVYNLMNTIG